MDKNKTNKTYWIIWTYIGNYSERPVAIGAENAEAAARKLMGYYSKDFAEKATLYVYDTFPACVIRKGTVESDENSFRLD